MSLYKMNFISIYGFNTAMTVPENWMKYVDKV